MLSNTATRLGPAFTSQPDASNTTGSFRYRTMVPGSAPNFRVAFSGRLNACTGKNIPAADLASLFAGRQSSGMAVRYPLSRPQGPGRHFTSLCLRLKNENCPTRGDGHELANWLGRFSTQDEQEKGNNGLGVARPGADTDAKCREPAPGSDPRILRSSEPIEFISGGRKERYLWVERVSAVQK